MLELVRPLAENEYQTNYMRTHFFWRFMIWSLTQVHYVVGQGQTVHNGKASTRWPTRKTLWRGQHRNFATCATGDTVSLPYRMFIHSSQPQKHNLTLNVGVQFRFACNFRTELCHQVCLHEQLTNGMGITYEIASLSILLLFDCCFLSCSGLSPFPCSRWWEGGEHLPSCREAVLDGQPSGHQLACERVWRERAARVLDRVPDCRKGMSHAHIAVVRTSTWACEA